MEKETKRCPYCGEEILAAAKKCKYCGEWLNTEDITPEANTTGNNSPRGADNIQVMNTTSSSVPSPDLTTMQYYISVNDQLQGPFTIEDLRNLQITPYTWVWEQGRNEWVPASQISELQSLFANQPQYQLAANPNGIPYQQFSQQESVYEDNVEEEEETVEETSTFKKVCFYLSILFYLLATLDFVLGNFFNIDMTGMGRMSPVYFGAIGVALTYIGGLREYD